VCGVGGIFAKSTPWKHTESPECTLKALKTLNGSGATTLPVMTTRTERSFDGLGGVRIV